MLEGIFEFIYTTEYNNSSSIINGIRILKYRKDVLLKNYYFSKETSFKRLTKNPYEVLAIEDMSNREKKEISSDYAYHYDTSIYYNDHYIWEKTDNGDKWKNNLNFIREVYSLIAFGDLIKSDVLFHNQVLYIDEKRNVIYYDETEDKIKKIGISQIKKKIGHDKDYHTLVVLPAHLTYEKKEDLIKIYENQDENLQKVKKVFEEKEIGPIVGKLARIKFKSRSQYCNCARDEIVLIEKKGKLRDRYNVIDSKGEIKQATYQQLLTLPELQQDDNLVKEITHQRKEKIKKEQEEGIPHLLTIEKINDFYLFCNLTNGHSLSIPRSIIPLFEVKDCDIKENEAYWIKIPKWFYKRKVEYYYN
jgi:hypothetical protein